MTRFVKCALFAQLQIFRNSYHFEILKAVYLQNAWWVFYTILRQSIVIQGNSIGVLSSGLLAELPAILDSFLPIPQVIS